MVSRPARRHLWTAFEQHALLCLLARQIQITGISNRGKHPRHGRKKGSYGVTGSMKHAYADVATALNRALNYRDETQDIAVEEVSAMIDKLLSERKAAVKFMERQKLGKVTRSMKRVWDRGLNFDGSVKEWLNGRKEKLEKLVMEKASDKLTAAVENNTEGVSSGWGGQGEFLD